jgi:hypothetical protein
MIKKGRPAEGDVRALTRAEVKYSGLSRKLKVFLLEGKIGLVLSNRKFTADELSKGILKLEKFWANDTSGRFGRI